MPRFQLALVELSLRQHVDLAADDETHSQGDLVEVGDELPHPHQSTDSSVRRPTGSVSSHGHSKANFWREGLVVGDDLW